MAHRVGSSETLKDYNTLKPNMRKSIVQEALPEHYREDYPNLVEFLEGYYDFLDSDQSFGGIINELQTVRDVEDTKLSELDYIFGELALGVSNDQFKIPREAIRNFGNFFRVKGSLFSGEGFFRGFFDEDVEISYPKKKIFTIGGPQIGPNHGYVTQNAARFQVFSLFIKSPLSISAWEELWRKFVHPSGFYLSAEVLLEGTDGITIKTDESVPDPFKNIFFVADIASITRSAEGEVSHLNDYWANSYLSPGGHINEPQYRTNPYRLIGYWADSDQAAGVGSRLYASINDVITEYKDLKEWADWGITYDNTLDSNATAITFDNTYERYDMRNFQTYRSDQGQFVAPGYIKQGYILNSP